MSERSAALRLTNWHVGAWSDRERGSMALQDRQMSGPLPSRRCGESGVAMALVYYIRRGRGRARQFR
jgi:hypothetical protein